eukprot:5398699-Amphidinium_carterae.1
MLQLSSEAFKCAYLSDTYPLCARLQPDTEAHHNPVAPCVSAAPGFAKLMHLLWSSAIAPHPSCNHGTQLAHCGNVKAKGRAQQTACCVIKPNVEILWEFAKMKSKKAAAIWQHVNLEATPPCRVQVGKIAT